MPASQDVMTDLQAACAELICGDDLRAEKAAACLPQFGADGLQALHTLLKSQNMDERWWAVRAMAGFEEGASADLQAAIKDKSSEVRQAAAMAFCHHPDANAIPLLIAVLDDPDPMTGKLASNALILHGTEATLALLQVLTSGKPSARLEAVRALAEIKDVRAIPGLINAYETDSALIQYWAALGLDRLGVGMVYIKPD
jgi:hypothetical protein